MPVALEAVLKQSFGYSEFRPLQREIIEDALAGRDVFALLPTGGGKSLCFQLPALRFDGLTVVVSPLISLMKDQVDALEASGIPATFLNSTLGAEEARSRFRNLHRGEIRLLYVAPERLMLPGFLEVLKGWKVSLIAVDEAHCISEWGHDFRPEYRQLASLRDHFPGVPIMALTATATERVREDIVTQLGLEDCRAYVASFNRPNLHYQVVAKSDAFGQLFEFVRARRREAGIVYCFSRKSAEAVAQKLVSHGIAARPYHAGLTPAQREQNQELFLRDEINVICATIAFGMGINKPNVRYVVHYDLPKNVEGYYQETGRAGRDGLRSDCLLLFSAADVIKQKHFIEEKPTPKEQEIARAQLQQIVHYAETNECRRVALLRYFGEEWPEGECDGCDNCLSPRETFDATLQAQKLLSCAYRVRQQSDCDFGLNHLVEVLAGADTEPIRKWRHNQVSTYGVGKELSRGEWTAIGRELMRRGFLAQASGKFATVSLTDEGVRALKERATFRLTRPARVADGPIARSGSRKKAAGEIPCDEALFEKLRELRRTIAAERGVPPYIIFPDTTLRWMANRYPATRSEFGALPGVGERKQEQFAEPFLEAISEHVGANPRQIFSDSFSEAAPVTRQRKAAASDTASESLRLHRTGLSLEQVAAARNIATETVAKHLIDAIGRGEAVEIERLVPPAKQRILESAVGRGTLGTLKEIKELVGEAVSYDEIRLYLAHKRR